MLKRIPNEVIENDEHNATLLNWTASVNVRLFENRLAMPTEQQYLHAAEFASARVGFELNPARITTILSLYPAARIKLALRVAGSIENDTEVRDLIADALADFFLGCDWPTYGHRVDMTKFCKALQKQAVKMGFTQ